MKKVAIITTVLYSLGVSFLHAQPNVASGGSLSRQMRTALRFYEQGQDISAMDRFMEILTKGDPSERSMANEYINLITHRMNTLGGAGGSPTPKTSARLAEPAKVNAASPIAFAEPAAAPATSVAEPATAPAASSRADAMPAANKALMRKEIRVRLRSAVEKSISDIKSISGVRVVMRENGDPDAIGIPASLLFKTGIAFAPGATKMLDPLTKLVFALGATAAVILPEGAAVGDTKVLDMRRTMGIAAHLFNAGVAPPRIRVNLHNTQVDIPKDLRDFQGVIVVFVYNQSLNLVVESAIGEELGPPISLGVYPSSFRPARGQGVIVEFSVTDPPAGLVSWKFQLLQPTRDGAELAPLQHVTGGGSVFHQIFWNGKQNYFGEILAPGRYECVLTALDAKNRQRSIHRWIELLGDVPGEKRPAARPAVAKTRARVLAPRADMAKAREKPLVAGVTAARKAVAALPRVAAVRVKQQVVKRSVRGKKAGKPAKGKSARVNARKDASAWTLNFKTGTYQLTPEAAKLLLAVVAAMPAHPLKSLRVTGCYDAKEADGAALAGQRVKMIAGILVNRHQVDSKRIIMASSAAKSGAKATLAFISAS